MEKKTASIRLHGKRRIEAPAILVLVMLFAGVSAQASNPFAGNITRIDSGKSKAVLNILRAGKKGFDQAKSGDAVFVGDTIKTGAEQKAQIQLSDSSTINMGPNAVLKLKAASLKAGDAKRSIVFKAFKGAIRFIISKTFKEEKHSAARNWIDSNVVVEATTMVAGVRGTDFIIVVSTDMPLPQTEAAVFEGIVTARNSDLKVKGNVTLSADQMVTITRGSTPLEASPLSQEHKAALINLTTPTGNGYPGASGQISQKGKTAKYTDSDMERDIAAGVALSQVFERSITSGMTVNTMIGASIEAGVTGYVTVYTAITDGYPATAVVDAAITSGAPLVDVVAAAVMAGAETRAIIGGAELAGVSEEAIAAALSDYTSNLSPYGYKPPDPKPSPAQIGPPPAGMIGGGGGNTPNPNPSRYKP